MIEPISVCELEAGSPRYQVPRFQMIAPISSAKTIAKPALDPTWRISSTGSSAMMPKATAPLDARTPRKLKSPDQTHRQVRRHRVGVDDRGDGVRRVVEPVDELEAERDQQRDPQQHEWQPAGRRHAALGDVDVEAVGDRNSASAMTPRKTIAIRGVKANVEIGSHWRMHVERRREPPRRWYRPWLTFRGRAGDDDAEYRKAV